MKPTGCVVRCSKILFYYSNAFQRHRCYAYSFRLIYHSYNLHAIKNFFICHLSDTESATVLQKLNTNIQYRI